MIRKIAVTGIGMVSPIGKDKEECFNSLLSAKGAVVKKFQSRHGFEYGAFCVRGFEDWAYPEPDPAESFALSAVDEAVRDAGLGSDFMRSSRMGVVFSSSKGAVRTHTSIARIPFDERSALEWRTVLESIMPDKLLNVVCSKYKITGPSKSIVTACATGTHSIIGAVDLIQSGMVDACIAGAADSSIDDLIVAGYKKMRAYTDDNICPYSAQRSGFMIGEGAGALVIESVEAAEKRGAEIYAEIESVRSGAEVYHSFDFDHSKNTLSRIIRELLNNAGISTVDYINTHGTGTLSGDFYEASQIKKVFGKRAADVPFSSTKAFTGHMLGAAGAVEAGLTLLCMQNSFLPPTLNFTVPDFPEKLDYIPNSGRHEKIKRALSLSMGFGGQIGVLLFKDRGV